MWEVRVKTKVKGLVFTQWRGLRCCDKVCSPFKMCPLTMGNEKVQN